MNSVRKAVIGAALAGAALAGGALGGTLLNGTASAQEADTSTATTDSGAVAVQPAAPASRPAMDPSKGGHHANGITEALLTGDTADKVSAAALAAVPGGTIERVENDAEGATYEAHMTNADGERVTVKLGADFSVSDIETGGR